MTTVQIGRLPIRSWWFAWRLSGGLLIPGVTISGRVADTGLLVPDMQIAAGPFSGDHLSGVSTDMNGNYTLSGLPDGNIEVVVRG